MNDVRKLYNLWRANALDDQDLVKELKSIENDEAKIEDAFYRDLAFGTGGLRGVIGAGSNRMNIYTVAKASQGLADYLNKNYIQPKVCIGYDSRIKSNLFAKTAAGVFAANGVNVEIYSELRPVPMVSYAVRHENASAGVMVTASHNPSKYNGYKVYGEDGCQITTEAAKEILSYIEEVDPFKGVKKISFEEGISRGMISYTPEKVYDDFVDEIKSQSLLGDEKVNKDVKIIYTPLHGAGLKPVLRALNESGFTNITVVKEQEQPDGYFTTCPYPNPEIKEAMELGIEYCKKYNADLLLATDPDCDRVGTAVKDDHGNYVLLSGNEMGLLLFDYVCSRRIALNKMPKDPEAVKTIVTMDMAEKIADHYGVTMVSKLTGFKFIGEEIGRLEKLGKENSYIFGFEESYGYLSGTYVRDKDGVNAAFLICEMFAYYKSKGVSLYDKLNEIYETYGYCLNTLHSFQFEGSSGMKKMQDIMDQFRTGLDTIGGKNVIEIKDYSKGVEGLPKSNVIKFYLDDECSVVVRPSGTEPKLKLYVSVCAKNKTIATNLENKIVNSLNVLIG